LSKIEKMKNTIEKGSSRDGASKEAPQVPIEKLESEIKRHVEAFITALEQNDNESLWSLDAESSKYAREAKESEEAWITISRREIAQMTGQRKLKNLWKEKRRLVGLLYDKHLMRRFMAVAERYDISFSPRRQFSGMSFEE
jgi:hypothetical protein